MLGRHRLLVWLSTVGFAATTLAFAQGVPNRRLAIAQAQATTRQKSHHLPDIVDHWAEPAIRNLVQADVLKGFVDGTFRPEQPVTRAEFATMLTKGFNQPPISGRSCSFSDLSRPGWTHWAKENVEMACRQGFIAGYPNGTFRPDAPVTRQEVIVAIANGLNLSGDATLPYDDSDQIADWARDAVEAAYRRGIVIPRNAPNHRQFSPQRDSRRALTSVFIFQARQGSADAAEIFQLIPSSGHNISLSYDGVPTAASLNSRLQDTGDVLITPANRSDAGANLAFRSAQTGNIVSGYIAQAGFSNHQTFYRYPCEGQQGHFVLAWTNATGSGCNTVIFGVPPTISRSQSKQRDSSATQVSVSPVGDDIAWIQADTAAGQFVMQVLSGVVEVKSPAKTWRVPARHEYSLDINAVGAIEENQRLLLPSERQTIAESLPIQNFLSPNSWPPEIGSQLPEYRQRWQIFQAVASPDPAAQTLSFEIIERQGTFSGRIRITGEVSNIGNGTFESNQGQQTLVLYEEALGAAPRTVARLPFTTLPPGESLSISYDRAWNASSPAEGEFPPSYRLDILYDPDIRADGNASNDDANVGNNQLTRSGAGINTLFR